MGGGRDADRANASYPTLVGKPVAKQIHNIYRDRLRMFTDGGQYKSQSLLSRMYRARASGKPAVKLAVWPAPGLTRPTFKDATKSSNEYKETQIGHSFGPSWSTHWFRVRLTVPESMTKLEQLELQWDANNEGMVWTEEGVPLQGLTGGGERIEWILPSSFRDGKEHTIYIEMACNGMFGNSPSGDANQPPAPDRYFTLQQADIVSVNMLARALYFDFWEIGDAAREFPEDSWEEHQALQVCNKIMDAFIAGNMSDESIAEGRKIAQSYIGTKVDSEHVYDGDDAENIVNAIGHCHIDTCWLWPWAETKRKIARSWLNQCDLLDRYPEHRFCASQAQQYKWLEKYYPSAYDRVKQHVKKGTFQPIGGSWVEHDTNMPSGESLVRQFLYGQRYFESHFGERSTTFWLPDTFGYSAQLPQISRLAGMPRFFTQKLSWNNINNFPHTTFNWVALDGSQVLCHMTPCNTYTAEADFGDVKRSITQHKSMDQDPKSLLVFGKGDGGGGPTWQQIEKLRRCRGMSDKIGTIMPKLKLGQNVDDFFAKLEKTPKSGTDFVTWYGELYLELHRGTYTTQSNNKRNNRKTEQILHDLEYVAALASIQDAVSSTAKPYKYPKKDIDEMWENILLCQFHDCLPGSSIEMCYDDSEELYTSVFERAEKLLREVLEGHLGFLDLKEEKAYQAFALNTLPFPRREIVKVPLKNKPFYGLLEARAHGLGTILPLPSSASTQNQQISIERHSPNAYTMANGAFRVQTIDGAITRIYDMQADRELIPHGAKANQLVLYDDKPLYWQAWDVEVFHLRSRKELTPHKMYISDVGPHRVAITSEYKISEKSWIRTELSMVEVPQSKRPDLDGKTGPPPLPIEISAECSWHEDKKFLKVEFPVDIRNTSFTCETQYGLVSRPTHYNTSWDAAKFEVCQHRFADLSESTYGVAVLNDSKYGAACEGNVLRLSLLRAPKAPDGHADMGTHFLRWAVLPHTGPLDERVVRAARAFNNPVALATPNGYGAGKQSAIYPHTGLTSFIWGSATHDVADNAARLLGSIRLCPACTDAGIVLDTLKRGEDDADVRAAADASSCAGLAVRAGRSIIVRCYDSLGGKSRGRILFGAVPVKAVHVTNALEDDGEELDVESFAVDGSEGVKEKGVRIELRAFEVKTFRLSL